MKNKLKRFSNKLTAVVVATALVFGGISVYSVRRAMADTLDDGRVAYFTFEDTLNDQAGGNAATPKLQGLGDYTGTVTYQDGRDVRAGKAVKLSGFGLKLNHQNVGETYTLSMWIKPDGTIGNNSSVAFLGYHDPERWMSVAGNGGQNVVKYWANDKVNNVFAWSSFGTTDLKSDKWHHLVITGDTSGSKVYMDKVLRISTDKTDNPLSGENADVYLCTNFWDACVNSLVDDVMIYNRVLSEEEREWLFYSGMSAADYIDEYGISVRDVQAVEGIVSYVDTDLPAFVLNDDATTLTCTVSDDSVASINAAGEITCKKVGTTGYTVRASNGLKSAEASATLTVSSEDDVLVGRFTFDEENLNSTKGSAAKPIVKGLGDYTGNITYEKGRYEGSKAVRLSNFGLDLDKKNIGKNYTVSLWMKPDGAFPNTNQQIVFLGQGDDKSQRWMGLASSAAGSNSAYYWGSGGSFSGYQYPGYFTLGSGAWHNLVITGTEAGTKLYVDGVLSIDSNLTNHPLDQESGNILVGANYWDTCFPGMVDDIVIYRYEQSSKVIRSTYNADLTRMVGDELDAILSGSSYLGRNDSAEDVRYDLQLPSSVLGRDVVWTSSQPASITDSGYMVKAPTDGTKDVTFTATVAIDKTAVTKTFDVILAKLDRTRLDALVSELEAVNPAELSDADKTRRSDLLAQAESVDIHEEVEMAESMIDVFLRNQRATGDPEEQINPFAFITEPKEAVNLKAELSKSLFEVPEHVAPYVDVAYSSNDTDVVTYADGVATAKKVSGNAIVTATVTAKYDNWKMEYSTAVTVEGEAVTPPGPTPPGPTPPGPTPPGPTPPEPTPSGPDPAKELEKTVEIQNALRNDAVTRGAGTKAVPVTVEVKQAADDTVSVVENYVKGKIKRIDIVAKAGVSSNVITLNAGTKYQLDGKKGTYKIVADSNGGIKKNQRGSKSASVSKKGALKLKKVKGKGTYSVTLEYEKADDSGTCSLIINVENLEFNKSIKKTVLFSVPGEVKNSSASVIKTVSENLASEEAVISLSDAAGRPSEMVSGVWSLSAGKGSKVRATMTVAPDGKSVTIKPVAGMKGKVTLQVVINKKKYKTSINILNSTKKKLKASQITPPQK